MILVSRQSLGCELWQLTAGQAGAAGGGLPLVGAGKGGLKRGKLAW